jgi:hypothetical protein
MAGDFGDLILRWVMKGIVLSKSAEAVKTYWREDGLSSFRPKKTRTRCENEPFPLKSADGRMATEATRLKSKKPTGRKKQKQTGLSPAFSWKELAGQI